MTDTIADLAALGYTLRYETADHVLQDAYRPGLTIFTPGGLQADGTYAYKLDLDRHRPEQDPDDLLRHIRRRVGDDLYHQLVIRRTKRRGYHIVFQTTCPLNPVKVYDPRRPALHVGELLDARIELTGDYVQGSAATIPTLTTLELCKFFSAIHAPGHRIEDDTEYEVLYENTTKRKERMAEGLDLIAGWQTIRGWRVELDQKCDRSPQLAKYRAELRTNKDRSAGYGNFVQSLMLHAAGFGRTTEERCQMVAAMAIGTGANGKEREKDYRIEHDTAVLIPRILHGDAMEPRPDGTIPHWQIPRWASGQPLPPRTPTPPAPPKPLRHRPPGDKAKGLARLRRILEDRALDTFGKVYYGADDLEDWGARCKVGRRTIQDYLSIIEMNGEITRGRDGGRGACYWFVLNPQSWDANKSLPAPETTAESVQSWDANAPAPARVPMLETDNETVPTIEVEGAPKTRVPAPAPERGALSAADLAALAWVDSPAGQRLLTKAGRTRVDAAVFARVDAVVRGRHLAVVQRYSAEQCDAWLASHAPPAAAEVQVLGASHSQGRGCGTAASWCARRLRAARSQHRTAAAKAKGAEQVTKPVDLEQTIAGMLARRAEQQAIAETPWEAGADWLAVAAAMAELSAIDRALVNFRERQLGSRVAGEQAMETWMARRRLEEQIAAMPAMGSGLPLGYARAAQIVELLDGGMTESAAIARVVLGETE